MRARFWTAAGKNFAPCYPAGDAALIRGLENQQQITRWFWRAYTHLVLDGKAPKSVQGLGEALQRKHQQAVVLIGHTAREHRCGELPEQTGSPAE